ncbi:MAG: 4-hydroxythreonine-4-phosphate dehydrogenase PdxA [Leptolyngbya sp. PLA3]|nr:MAG: 4-hydroxythreonine-4-phosphate dehydrogenase PdxA [Cyanobacteria bacterium CYA]MCE7967437.1 4-hydroxythreonine-4-phosphate dehydrogenase PdxA [Leptolyngbya sp. PL-A3]
MQTTPSPSESRPSLAVTIGDPGGIGPEVVVAALSDRELWRRGRFLVLGSESVLHRAAEMRGIEPFWWSVPLGSSAMRATGAHDVVLLDTDRAWGAVEAMPTPNRGAGAYSHRLVEEAIGMALGDNGERVSAIVTGPISKQAWVMAGKSRFPGHTELLADRFRARRVAMMFAGPKLRVVLATIHLPLMDLRNALTIGRVFDAIDLGAEGCGMLGVTRPRVAVCGLNPHAGEGGLMGDEEERLIAPAIEHARNAGIDASGPFPADTVFAAAVSGKYDLVVAMYHDQGLIPVKLLSRDESVNLTIGLPIIRTSPDHGTAFDIAGKGLADPGSMRAALALAAEAAGRVGGKQD